MRADRRIGAACSRGALALLLGLLTIVLGASPASAYWTSTGSGAAAAQTGRLAPPTTATVPAAAVSDVPVGWTAGSGGVEPEGYYVTRYLGAVPSAACGSGPLMLLTDSSCEDSGVADGDYTYVVTAVFRTWTAAGAPSSTVTVVNPAQLGFLDQPMDTPADAPIAPAVVVRLESAAGDPVAYAGVPITLAIGTNPNTGSLAGTTTVVTAADGTATFSNLSVDRAGVGYTLVATNPDLTSATSGAFTILAPPPLGRASSYSVLAGAGVVNTLATTLSGDLGIALGFVATGFPPGTVAGDTHIGDADAANALADFSDAYASMRALTPTAALPGDLGGQTRGPGVYSTGAALAVTGILTLDAGGDPNAVFVFKVDAALNMGATGQIVLVNGAQAANVYWVVNGAVTIGANAQFKGTILADGPITLGDSTELIGRAFATGAVTMANNTVRFTPALPPTLTITGGATSITKDTTPEISGTTSAPPGTAVKVTVGGQTLTTTVQTGGDWTVTAAPLLANSYPIVAQVRDAAGNATKASQTLVVEVNPAPLALGSADTFSVLSIGNVNNTRSTHLSGDLGLVGLVSFVVGLPPPVVDGATHRDDATAEAAQADLRTAITAGQARTPHTQFAGDLGGRTFHVGVHESAAAVGLTGVVTLDGQGDPNAVFIFQINGAFTTAAGCQVNLVNAAQASNVFWVVDGAVSAGATCALQGNLLVDGAITLGANTTLVGQALARAVVTLAGNNITGVSPRVAARQARSAPTSSSFPSPSDEPTDPGPAGSDDPTPTPTATGISSESASPTPTASPTNSSPTPTPTPTATP